MTDTKLRPTSTMKSKDKSSEQRFGHMNVTNRNASSISVFHFRYDIDTIFTKYFDIDIK